MAQYGMYGCSQTGCASVTKSHDSSGTSGTVCGRCLAIGQMNSCFIFS